MKPLTLALFVSFRLSGQTHDLYPQVRALALEAEAAAANIPRSNDFSDPHSNAGDILARAGYLEDAENSYAKSPRASSGPADPLLRSWVVYGQTDRIERLMNSETSPEKKAAYSAVFADMLWRTDQAGQARVYYESARSFALKIVDPRRRMQLVATIDQGLKYVSDPPPFIVSATPQPMHAPRNQDSPFPAFPITTDGFQDLGPTEKSLRGRADEAMMKQLYDRAAAGDLNSIVRITQSSATPFQKALSMASLQHLLIQQNEPELAEKYANRIPATDSPSSLAKAESLSATAIAWLRVSDNERARAAFDLATRIVLLVPDLKFGRISVFVSIAVAQNKGGLIEDGNTTFRHAIGLAQTLPLRPTPPPGIYRLHTPLGTHYVDEAFDWILRAAIRSNNLAIANEVVETWRKIDASVGSSVVNAWLLAGHSEKAIAAARLIKDPKTRVTELFALATSLLSDAGASIF